MTMAGQSPLAQEVCELIKIEALEDIKTLIDTKIEEDLTLEYKKVLGHNRDIAKEICAFANTEGGIIIYGIESKDRIPTNLFWIVSNNIEENIQNIVATSIQPRIEGVKVFRYPNPTNEKQAIIVIEVVKSLYAPHMVDNRYYKRRGSVSMPMDHEEVKSAMLGSGRNVALQLEISANLSLIDKTYSLIERVYVLAPQRRKPIAFVPFRTDAWTAILSSGLLFTLSEAVIKNLVEAYAIIHEINSLIDWLKVENEPIVHTSAYEDSFREAGTYIPAIIKDKLIKLKTLLQQAGSQS